MAVREWDGTQWRDGWMHGHFAESGFTDDNDQIWCRDASSWRLVQGLYTYLPPINLTRIDRGQDFLRFGWSAPSQPGSPATTEWQVRLREQGSPFTALSPGVLAYQFGGLDPSTHYTFDIRRVHRSGALLIVSPTASIDWTTLAAPVTPPRNVPGNGGPPKVVVDKTPEPDETCIVESYWEASEDGGVTFPTVIVHETVAWNAVAIEIAAGALTAFIGQPVRLRVVSSCTGTHISGPFWPATDYDDPCNVTISSPRRLGIPTERIVFWWPEICSPDRLLDGVSGIELAKGSRWAATYGTSILAVDVGAHPTRNIGPYVGTQAPLPTDGQVGGQVAVGNLPALAGVWTEFALHIAVYVGDAYFVNSTHRPFLVSLGGCFTLGLYDKPPAILGIAEPALMYVRYTDVDRNEFTFEPRGISMTTNEWHHLSVQFKQGQGMSLTLDGVIYDHPDWPMPDSIPASVLNMTDEIQIGCPYGWLISDVFMLRDAVDHEPDVDYRHCNFTGNRAPYQFVVPEGVTLIHIDAIGASGGRQSAYNRVAGAKPGRVRADMTVVPGQELYIWPGRCGDTADIAPTDAPGTTFTDDFERATIGPDWEQLPYTPGGPIPNEWLTDTHAISLEAQPTGSFAQDHLFRVGEFDPGAQYCEIDVKNLWTATGAGQTVSAEAHVNVGEDHFHNGFSIRAGTGIDTVDGAVLIANDPCDNFTFAPWSLNGTPTVVSGGHAGNCFQLAAGSTQRIMYIIPVAARKDTVTVGAWFNLTPGGVGWQPITLRGDNGVTIHVVLNLSSNGTLLVSSAGVTLATTGAGAMPIATWTFVELSAKLADGTAGSVTLRVNGVVVAQNLACDTKNAGTATVFDTLWIQSTGSISGWKVDDIYLRNDLAFGAAPLKRIRWAFEFDCGDTIGTSTGYLNLTGPVDETTVVTVRCESDGINRLSGSIRSPSPSVPDLDAVISVVPYEGESSGGLCSGTRIAVNSNWSQSGNGVGPQILRAEGGDFQPVATGIASFWGGKRGISLSGTQDGMGGGGATVITSTSALSHAGDSAVLLIAGGGGGEGHDTLPLNSSAFGGAGGGLTGGSATQASDQAVGSRATGGQPTTWGAGGNIGGQRGDLHPDDGTAYQGMGGQGTQPAAALGGGGGGGGYHGGGGGGSSTTSISPARAGGGGGGNSYTKVTVPPIFSNIVHNQGHGTVSGTLVNINGHGQVVITWEPPP